MKTTRWLGVPCALALLVAAAPPNPTPPSAAPSLYDRIAAKLEAQPALAARLGAPGPEMRSIAWMLGTWEVTAQVLPGHTRPPSTEKGRTVVTAILGGTWLQLADTYPAGVQDLGFVTYDPTREGWVSLALDSYGNAVTVSGKAWGGSKLVFRGRARILGEEAELRQTIERRGDDAWQILNEEKMPDGSWRALDLYSFARLAAP